ncbi:MAG: (deoxy)nucleoside triphosphate pyrophosphohydrolase [Lentisphaeraceae bacterium]|nr:(deoxy)nucleoside triphosphate pyrophosphohydrolase [Lentisphaeraceae bacterium]
MKSLPIIKVTAGILRKESKVLIAQRSEAKYNGLWEFPGGKIEVGETPQQCLKRELEEELCIQSVVGDLFCVTQWQRENKVIELHTYLISSFKGTLKACVHNDLKWVEIKDLCEDVLLPADKPLVDKLKSV